MRPQIYCSLCGAPMLESDDCKGEPTQWLTNAMLLATAHDTDEGIEFDEYVPRKQGLYGLGLGSNVPDEAQRRVLRLEALALDTSMFKIIESDKQVDPMNIKVTIVNPGTSLGSPLYLPIHNVCLKIVDSFLDSVRIPLHNTRVQIGDKITSEKHLWEVLWRRLSGDAFRSNYILPEPHGYFGGENCRGLEWDPGNDKKYGEIHESNPLEISRLTESILRNLEPMPTCHLPTESKLQQPSSHELHRYFQDLDLNCDYEHNPSWWCSSILSKRALPWLWDLDVNVVRTKEQEGNWNWELLVRKLTQLEIHEPGDTSLELPLQLKNRRRIWRLLEEARVGDYAEWQNKNIAEQRERYYKE